MEGLIKGLANAAIDHFGKRNDDDGDNADQHPSRDRDEQSRSSWAQVVSGDDDQNNEDESRQNQGRPTYNKPVRSSRDDQYQENSYRRDDQYQANTYRRDDQSNAWQKDSQTTSFNQEGGSDNDGWETVKKKPARRHQKVHMDHWNGYKCAPEEQAYADEVNIGSDTKPSQVELADLSEACNKLWELDINRLVPGRDYEVDVGDGKKVYDKRDQAEGCLLSWVSEDVFKRPTFSRFCSLLDNYNPHAGYKEAVTNEEKQEEAAFIEEISRTAPIKYLYNYLVAKGDISGSYDDFKRTLTTLWFGLYSRCGTSGSSSAFEHVFVGEIKQQGEQQVTGFHNWLQFYLEEAKGNVDYQGYIFPRRRGEIPDSETQLLTIQFEWNGVLKSVSSTLIGVSPEFEMALYTLCFFAGGEDNRVQLGPYSVNVKCYHNGNKLGSAFPIAES